MKTAYILVKHTAIRYKHRLLTISYR